MTKLPPPTLFAICIRGDHLEYSTTDIIRKGQQEYVDFFREHFVQLHEQVERNDEDGINRVRRNFEEEYSKFVKTFDSSFEIQYSDAWEELGQIDQFVYFLRSYFNGEDNFLRKYEVQEDVRKELNYYLDDSESSIQLLPNFNRICDYFLKVPEDEEDLKAPTTSMVKEVPTSTEDEEEDLKAPMTSMVVEVPTSRSELKRGAGDDDDDEDEQEQGLAKKCKTTPEK